MIRPTRRIGRFISLSGGLSKRFGLVKKQRIGFYLKWLKSEYVAPCSTTTLCVIFMGSGRLPAVYMGFQLLSGEGHTCGISGFKEGTAYPTINLDAIHRRLIEISKDLVVALKSKYGRMGEMLVPLSMALLNQYDERYLGVAEDDTDTNTAKE